MQTKRKTKTTNMWKKNYFETSVLAHFIKNKLNK